MELFYHEFNVKWGNFVELRGKFVFVHFHCSCFQLRFFFSSRSPTQESAKHWKNIDGSTFQKQRNIVLKVNGFLSIPHFCKDFIPGNFTDALKAIKMQNKIPRNWKSYSTTFRKCFFLGKKGFSCMPWIMKARQRRDELLMHPKCFSIIHETPTAKFSVIPLSMGF